MEMGWAAMPNEDFVNGSMGISPHPRPLARRGGERESLRIGISLGTVLSPIPGFPR
jgi:hypothetical protein